MVLGSGKNKPETGVRLLFRFFDVAPSVLRPPFANVVALMVINRLISPRQLIFQFKLIVDILSLFNRKTNCTRIPSIIYSRDNALLERSERNVWRRYHNLSVSISFK